MPINFTLTYTHKTNDPTDDTGDVAAVAVSGEVLAVAQFPDGATAVGSDGGYTIKTFKGYMDAGVLKSKVGGTPGMRVWANDPAVFALTRLPYKVLFDVRDPNGLKVHINPSTFDAPSTDTVVPLEAVTPVAGAIAVAVVRRAGYAEDIIDSTATGRAVVTAANAAAARIAIGVAGSGGEWESYANLAAFPATGNANLEYVAEDTGKLYRWNSGSSAYVQIADKASVGLGAADNTSDVNKPVSTAQAALIATKAGKLTKTAIQTADYTAVAYDLVLVDATTQSVVVTAPNNPADTALFAVKRLDDPGKTGHTVTIVTAGSDHFNTTTGPTSAPLSLQNHGLLFQYSTSDHVHTVTGDDLPLGQADTRYRGTVATGVKGGRTTLLRRRDITNLDLLSPWYGAITAAVTNTGATTMTSPTTNAMSATPSWCTPLGGTLVALPAFTSAFMFNWRTPNGGAVTPTVFPWPTTTTIEFELDTTTLGAFEVSFRPTVASASFFYNLWIDGRRVWDLPQTATVGQNSANNFLKFTGLPTGVHRYRVSLGSSAIWQVFTPQNTLPVPVPAKGPRLFFLGDSLESIGGAAGSSGVHTGIEMGPWPWRFAEMIGCNDVWLGGMGATGFIANAGGRTVTDGVIVSGSTNFDSATATFVTGDTSSPNNKVQIVGAGPAGGVLSALIVSRTSATRVVLDTPASTSVTSAWASVGGSGANYPIRAYTDVIPAAPDVVFIDSYHNDTSFSASAIANSLTLTLNAIQSALPNTMIIVTGGFDSSGVGGASYTTIDNALLAVCTAHGVPYVAPANTGTVYDGAGNAVAVQGAWIDTNTTNLYIESDGTHETDAGMKYLAHRKVQSVLALLPA